MSPPMAFMTPGGVMPPLRPEVPMPSYRRNEMPGSGGDRIPACKRFGQANWKKWS